jgi:apolipoprotein N-acyltransferase
VVAPSPDGARTPARCDEPLLERSEAFERIQALAIEKDAVVIVGWFQRAEDGLANENFSLVFGSDGEVGDRYDKVRLVPFGEFVPLRSLIEVFSSEVPGVDVRAGTEDAVIDTELGQFGVSISWEVFFEDRARDAIGNGGQVLLNPTNGSSYWLAILQSQQVASSRLRALETDRWVLQAAPTGFSAVVDPDGEVHQRTGISEQGVLRETIELREGRTPAVVLGAWPMLLFSLLVIGGSMISRRREGALTPRSKE